MKMKHLSYDKDEKVFTFFSGQTSEKFPTILALRQKGDSTTFWANTIDSYDFPVFFNIYDLDDVIKDESGEYIKKAFAVVDCKSLKYFYPKELVNLVDNQIEVVFNPPRKITYLVNFTDNFGFYTQIKNFQCPKTGSYLQNRLVNNEIIQKLILSKNQIKNIFHHKKNHFQKLFNDQSQYDFNAIKLEDEIINYLVKENSNSLNSLTEIETEDMCYVKKNLIDSLKSILDNAESPLKSKKVAIKFYHYYQINESNNESKEEKVLIFNPNDLSKDGNISDYLEKRLNEIIDNSKSYSDLYVLVEEYLESGKELSSLNPKFSNNHLGQTCFMKSHSLYPELSNLFFRFSRNEVVHRKDSMLFPDEIKNGYISEKLKVLGKEFLERLEKLIDHFDVDKEFGLLMFSIEFQLFKSENNKDESIKVTGDKAIVPRITRIESIDKNILFNFNENFYFNVQACIRLNSFLNYILNASYFYMFRGLTFASLTYLNNEDFFYQDCKKNGIKYYIIDSYYTDEDYAHVLDREYFIQGDIYDPDRYEEESERLAKLLIDLDIHVLINFHNDIYPFAQLMREKMRKQVSLLGSEKQNEIYRNFNSYNLNTKIDLDKAEILINKKFLYNVINAKSDEKGVYSLGSNHEIIDDENYQTYEVKVKKILKIDNSSASMGFTLLDNSEDLKRIYPLNKKLYESSDASSGFGTFRKFESFISDFYEGSLHTMDLIMRKGECIFCNICDFVVDYKKWGKLVESYCEFPSKVFSTEAEIERAKNYIMDNVKMFDYFEDGSINVDFIVTDLGIKIIDYNPRVAGWYHNEYIRKIYGFCTFFADLICNVNTVFVPVTVPNYFSIQATSYVNHTETEGFVSEHEYEISKNKYYNDDKFFFNKIIVYNKNK